MQFDSVHDGGHAKFTHAVVDVVACRIIGRERLRARPDGQIGAGQIGRAAHVLGDERAVAFDGVLRRLARGQLFTLLIHRLDKTGGVILPVGRQLASHAALKLRRQFGIARCISRHALLPLGFRAGAPLLCAPTGVDL